MMLTQRAALNLAALQDKLPQASPQANAGSVSSPRMHSPRVRPFRGPCTPPGTPPPPSPDVPVVKKFPEFPVHATTQPDTPSSPNRPTPLTPHPSQPKSGSLGELLLHEKKDDSTHRHEDQGRKRRHEVDKEDEAKKKKTEGLQKEKPARDSEKREKKMNKSETKERKEEDDSQSREVLRPSSREEKRDVRRRDKDRKDDSRESSRVGDKRRLSSQEGRHKDSRSRRSKSRSRSSRARRSRSRHHESSRRHSRRSRSGSRRRTARRSRSADRHDKKKRSRSRSRERHKSRRSRSRARSAERSSKSDKSRKRRSKSRRKSTEKSGKREEESVSIQDKLQKLAGLAPKKILPQIASVMKTSGKQADSEGATPKSAHEGSLYSSLSSSPMSERDEPEVITTKNEKKDSKTRKVEADKVRKETHHPGVSTGEVATKDGESFIVQSEWVAEENEGKRLSRSSSRSSRSSSYGDRRSRSCSRSTRSSSSASRRRVNRQDSDTRARNTSGDSSVPDHWAVDYSGEDVVQTTPPPVSQGEPAEKEATTKPADAAKMVDAGPKVEYRVGVCAAKDKDSDDEMEAWEKEILMEKEPEKEPLKEKDPPKQPALSRAPIDPVRARLNAYISSLPKPTAASKSSDAPAIKSTKPIQVHFKAAGRKSISNLIGRKSTSDVSHLRPIEAATATLDELSTYLLAKVRGVKLPEVNEKEAVVEPAVDSALETLDAGSVGSVNAKNSSEPLEAVVCIDAAEENPDESAPVVVSQASVVIGADSEDVVDKSSDAPAKEPDVPDDPFAINIHDIMLPEGPRLEDIQLPMDKPNLEQEAFYNSVMAGVAAGESSQGAMEVSDISRPGSSMSIDDSPTFEAPIQFGPERREVAYEVPVMVTPNRPVALHEHFMITPDRPMEAGMRERPVGLQERSGMMRAMLDGPVVLRDRPVAAPQEMRPQLHVDMPQLPPDMQRLQPDLLSPDRLAGTPGTPLHLSPGRGLPPALNDSLASVAADIVASILPSILPQSPGMPFNPGPRAARMVAAAAARFLSGTPLVSNWPRPAVNRPPMRPVHPVPRSPRDAPFRPRLPKFSQNSSFSPSDKLREHIIESQKCEAKPQSLGSSGKPTPGGSRAMSPPKQEPPKPEAKHEPKPLMSLELGTPGRSNYNRQRSVPVNQSPGVRPPTPAQDLPSLMNIHPLEIGQEGTGMRETRATIRGRSESLDCRQAPTLAVANVAAASPAVGSCASPLLASSAVSTPSFSSPRVIAGESTSCAQVAVVTSASTTRVQMSPKMDVNCTEHPGGSFDLSRNASVELQSETRGPSGWARQEESLSAGLTQSKVEVGIEKDPAMFDIPPHSPSLPSSPTPVNSTDIEQTASSDRLVPRDNSRSSTNVPQVVVKAEEGMSKSGLQLLTCPVSFEACGDGPAVHARRSESSRPHPGADNDRCDDDTNYFRPRDRRSSFGEGSNSRPFPNREFDQPRNRRGSFGRKWHADDNLDQDRRNQGNPGPNFNRNRSFDRDSDVHHPRPFDRRPVPDRGTEEHARRRENVLPRDSAPAKEAVPVGLPFVNLSVPPPGVGGPNTQPLPSPSLPPGDNSGLTNKHVVPPNVNLNQPPPALPSEGPLSVAPETRRDAPEAPARSEPRACVQDRRRTLSGDTRVPRGQRDKDMGRRDGKHPKRPDGFRLPPTLEQLGVSFDSASSPAYSDTSSEGKRFFANRAGDMSPVVSCDSPRSTVSPPPQRHFHHRPQPPGLRPSRPDSPCPPFLGDGPPRGMAPQRFDPPMRFDSQQRMAGPGRFPAPGQPRFLGDGGPPRFSVDGGPPRFPGDVGPLRFPGDVGPQRFPGDVGPPRFPGDVGPPRFPGDVGPPRFSVDGGPPRFPGDVGPQGDMERRGKGDQEPRRDDRMSGRPRHASPKRDGLPGPPDRLRGPAPGLRPGENVPRFGFNPSDLTRFPPPNLGEKGSQPPNCQPHDRQTPPRHPPPFPGPPGGPRFEGPGGEGGMGRRDGDGPFSGLQDRGPRNRRSFDGNGPSRGPRHNDRPGHPPGKGNRERRRSGDHQNGPVPVDCDMSRPPPSFGSKQPSDRGRDSDRFSGDARKRNFGENLPGPPNNKMEHDIGKPGRGNDAPPAKWQGGMDGTLPHPASRGEGPRDVGPRKDRMGGPPPRDLPPHMDRPSPMGRMPPDGPLRPPFPDDHPMGRGPRDGPMRPPFPDDHHRFPRPGGPPRMGSPDQRPPFPDQRPPFVPFLRPRGFRPPLDGPHGPRPPNPRLM